MDNDAQSHPIKRKEMNPSEQMDKDFMKLPPYAKLRDEMDIPELKNEMMVAAVKKDVGYSSFNIF